VAWVAECLVVNTKEYAKPIKKALFSAFFIGTFIGNYYQRKLMILNTPPTKK
jgi:hypothetical protein